MIQIGYLLVPSRRGEKKAGGEQPRTPTHPDRQQDPNTYHGACYYNRVKPVLDTNNKQKGKTTRMSTFSFLGFETYRYVCNVARKHIKHTTNRT